VKKRLLQQEASQINSSFANLPLAGKIVPVLKYVVDSVTDDKFRLLISKTNKPFLGPITAAKLAKFSKWKLSSTEIMETKKAMKVLGIPENKVLEGRVFVKLGSNIFEISEHTREEIKRHYRPLLNRESVTIRKKKEEIT
jgi:hypothetical protein